MILFIFKYLNFPKLYHKNDLRLKRAAFVLFVLSWLNFELVLFMQENFEEQNGVC